MIFIFVQFEFTIIYIEEVVYHIFFGNVIMKTPFLKGVKESI